MSQPLRMGDRVIVRVGPNSVMADLNGKIGNVSAIRSDANWPIGVAIDGRCDTLFFKEFELDCIGDEPPTMEQIRAQEGM